MLRNLPKRATVVDIGCGPGTLIKELLDMSFKVIGLDIAPHMVNECRTRFGGNADARFDVGTAHEMPLANQSADAIIAMGLMEYLNDENDVLTEFHRVLKPSGIALITYPHYRSPTRTWDRFTHILATPYLKQRNKLAHEHGIKHREYTLKTTTDDIKKVGFKIRKIEFYNFKLAFRPLDALFPKLFVRIAERLERFGKTKMLRTIGTGFIVLAEKI